VNIPIFGRRSQGTLERIHQTPFLATITEWIAAEFPEDD
jgi:hypothetical protein